MGKAWWFVIAFIIGAALALALTLSHAGSPVQGEYRNGQVYQGWTGQDGRTGVYGAPIGGNPYALPVPFTPCR